MKKIIKMIAIGLATTATISMSFVKPVFAATQYNMQAVEKSIYDHLENWDTSFPISYYEKDVLDVVKKVAEKDGYLDISILRLEYRSIGTNATVTVTYRTTIEQENYVNNELKKAVSSIITPSMSEYQKVKAINKYLSDRFEYDYSFASNNAYLALTSGKTTCQGYAMTAYKMFNLAGIENKIITGTLDGVAHGWNLVKVDGVWYHVDVTNDDATHSDKYFLKDDSALKSSGFVWNSANYPKCEYNYDETPDEVKSITQSNTGSNPTLSNSKTREYWYKQSGYWYFMKAYGNNATGWNYIKGNWYYLGLDGKMQIGWRYSNWKWYYLSSDGAMKTGWIYDNGKWYYCYSNGVMAANTKIGGYTLNKNGVWIG